MILKLLLIIAVIAVVYFLFIKKKPLKSKKTKNREKLQSNDMVECKTCGIYAEVSDSILSGSSYYCSKECLENAQ
jgi:uncharacterized protein